jgi:hypothetical protein
MQQFKSLYADVSYSGTFANVQSCLRVGDLDEIGDGTHLLYFDMMGLFSFRQLSVKDAIDFWLSFLSMVGARSRTMSLSIPTSCFNGHPSTVIECRSGLIPNARGAMETFPDTRLNSTRMK